MQLQRVRTSAMGLLAAVAAVVAVTSLTAAPAEARARTKSSHHHAVQPWHGWTDNAFYLNGVRYAGGNRRGSASALNNWEGGFHPVAYWELLARQV